MIKAINKNLGNNKGFTLIELIVVIAILGIIAAIVAPNVFRYVNESKKSADIVNGAAIANAMLRANAEGYSFVQASDETDPVKITDAPNGVLVDGPKPNAKLAPTFIQSIPEVKENGYEDFAFSYKDDTLKIWKIGGTERPKQVYPEPKDE